LYATAALEGPASGITSVRSNPTSLHQRVKSAPVKSNATPNSISMLSDIISPKAFSRRASSDEGLDGDERASLWQGLVSLADQQHLVLKVPVVKDHAHRDDVGLGQRVAEEVDVPRLRRLKIGEQETIISNRSDESTYPEGKSVSRSGATPRAVRSRKRLLECVYVV
jgi:hypothetical protein